MRSLVLTLALVVSVVAPTIAEAQCAVCGGCFDDYDCGPGEFCADFTDGSYCTAYCDVELCPGDSACYQVPVDLGGSVLLCLNPGAENSFCDPSYTCGGGGGPVDLCAGVQCGPSSICSPATGTCIGGGGDTSAPPDTASPDTRPQDTATPPDTMVALDTGVVADTYRADSQSSALDGSSVTRTEVTGDGCACAIRVEPSRPSRKGAVLLLVLAAFGVVARRRR